MKRTNHFMTIIHLSIILTIIHPYYQQTPTYWHHFYIPRIDNLCTVSNSFSVLKNQTLLGCTVKCQFETDGVCTSYNYYQDMQVCQMFEIHGIGFEVKNGGCFYYQNEEIPATEHSNVALNKTVHTSGENCTSSGEASSLTDGSSSVGGSCTCVHRNPNEPKWFVVDLERDVEVHSVAVTTSATLATTTNYFVVGLAKYFNASAWQAMGTGPFTLCNQYPQTVGSSALLVLACRQNLGSFRFVVLAQNVTSRATFNVCELEVYEVRIVT